LQKVSGGYFFDSHCIYRANEFLLSTVNGIRGWRLCLRRHNRF